LIGGVSIDDIPASDAPLLKLFREYVGYSSFLVAPLPNMVFTRDTTCWIYGGVTLNPMYWPARRQETLLTAAIYKFHPSFANADFEVWWGDPDRDHGASTLEGGDVMPIGKGIVLIGMGERTSRQAIGQFARALFTKGAAQQVLVAGLPKSRAAMHLDTVFSFCDRDLVTIFPEVVKQIVTFSLRPDDTNAYGMSASAKTSRLSRRSATRWVLRNCASSKREATISPRSGSNGTTATIWSASNPAS
jgi:arginine deiminase